MNVERSAPHGAVFLSYASQDAEPAQRICEALRAAGVEVWFDQNELVGGDAWDAKIRGQISSCALFVPVISASTQARLEGYFRLEWKLAALRTHTMAEEKAFLLPVVIDATRDAEAKVPAEFKAVQWTRLSGGETAPAFIRRVQTLVGGTVMEPGSARPVAPGEGVASPTSPRSPLAKSGRRIPAAAWAVGAIAVVATGAALFFAGHKPATPKAGDATRPLATAAVSSIAENSISVLPFENRSTEPDSAYFADGMQDEIVTGLSVLAKLRVVGSRNSVEVFRASKKPLSQIARELGVAWIVRGSVSRTAEVVTVNVQLVRADADQVVWGRTFSSDRNRAATIQAEVVTGLTGALKTSVSPEEKALLARTPTANAEAFDLFLRQREILIKEGDYPASMNQRMRLLEKAVVLDPGFVRAWAELVWMRRGTAGRPTAARLAASKAALETLEKLAPQAPETALARVGYLARTVPPQQALAMYEKLAQEFPPSAGVLTQCGWLQMALGRWSEAIATMRQAIALDPLDPETRRSLINILFSCRRLREAQEEQRSLLAVRPELLQEGFRVGRIAYDIDGSTREMEQFFASIPRADWEKPEVAMLRSQWAQIQGNRAEAVKLAQLESDKLNHLMFVGIALAANGDREGARSRVGKAIESRQTRGEKRTEWEQSELAMLQALAGDRADALASAADLEGRFGGIFPEYQRIFRARLASIYAWAGEKERALGELERLFRESGYHFERLAGGDDQRARINVHELRTALEFQPLQGDPRFEALLNDPKNNAPLF